MNKKPGLFIAVALFAIIILATSFNLNLGGNEAPTLKEGVNPDSVLYICPAAGGMWESLSKALHILNKYASVFFSFIGIVLTFSWGWAIYQNLLKDKFNEDAYKNPWSLTKAFFWLIIFFTILLMTPNRFRTVEVRGLSEKYVLCESTSDDVRVVSYKRVRFR